MSGREVVAAQLTVYALVAAVARQVAEHEVLFSWLPDLTPISRDRVTERLRAMVKPLACAAVLLPGRVGVGSWSVSNGGLGSYHDSLRATEVLARALHQLGDDQEQIVLVRPPVPWLDRIMVSLGDVQVWTKDYCVMGVGTWLLQPDESERKTAAIAEIVFVGSDPEVGNPGSHTPEA